MNHRTFRNHYCLAALLLVLILGVQLANASSVPISGSYEVIQKTDLGSQTKILLRFHLTNLGQSPLSLQQLLLSDFGHPPSSVSIAPSITLPPGTSKETSQEFVIPRLQYDQWIRGVLPRAVLELRTATGARITQAIRLQQVSSGKAQ
jgi:hypothetical protein